LAYQLRNIVVELVEFKYLLHITFKVSSFFFYAQLRALAQFFENLQAQIVGLIVGLSLACRDLSDCLYDSSLCLSLFIGAIES